MEKFLILVSILVMDILELVLSILKFLSQLLNDLSTVLYLVLK